MFIAVWGLACFLQALWEGCDVHLSLAFWGLACFFAGVFGEVVMLIAVWGSACFVQALWEGCVVHSLHFGDWLVFCRLFGKVVMFICPLHFGDWLVNFAGVLARV